MLEYALPSQHYTVLDWPDRESYPNTLQRLKDIHSTYLVRFEYTVVGQILDLKGLGRMNRSQDITRFILEWSDDYQAVGIENLSQDRPIRNPLEPVQLLQL